MARCANNQACGNLACHMSESKSSRSTAVKQVGLFGGSFDPPHVGHVALVLSALEFLPEVWVVPAGNPVHRELSGRADAYVRLDWMQRIFASNIRVKVLDWEARIQKPTPTIETLRRVRLRHSELSPVLLMGEDAFAGMPAWVGYPEHLSLCDVFVFLRCGQPQSGLGEWQPLSIDQWREQAAGTGRIIRVEAKLPDVSATRLRMKASQGKSLQGIVPEMIRRNIEDAYGQCNAKPGVES